MLTLSLPPQHSIDDRSHWIAQSDPAWDHDRISAEAGKLADYARKTAAGKSDDEIAAAVTRAEASHPLALYYSGATRFSLDAPMTIPLPLRLSAAEDAVTTIRDYLIGVPTVFDLAPLGARAYREYVATLRQPGYWIPAIQHGLISIRDPDIELERDQSGRITERQIDRIDRADRSILSHVAAAVLLLSHWQGQRDEGKP